MNKRIPPLRLLRIGSMPTGRIEAFSDGVFAIVVTLLVLEIHVPQLTGSEISGLTTRLISMTPIFFIYALSFAIVCIWWVAHYHFFQVLRKSDRGLLWFNSLFLLWLAFIPFPTALMGAYPKERIAVISYGAVMALAGLSFSWMRFYAFFVGKLAKEEIDPALLKRAMIKSTLSPSLHIVAIALAFVSTRLAISMYVLIPILFFVPSKLERQTSI